MAELEALLAAYGRHRHRRSQANEIENVILDNLYAAFIDLEEGIQFSKLNADNVQVVNAALHGIIQSAKSMGAMSREFLAKYYEFKEERKGQVERALREGFHKKVGS